MARCVTLICLPTSWRGKRRKLDLHKRVQPRIAVTVEGNVDSGGSPISNVGRLTQTSYPNWNVSSYAPTYVSGPALPNYATFH